MYSIGTKISYQATGVCEIVDIINQKFAHTETRTYYVLKPIYDNSSTTIYCPVDTAENKLRPIPEADEIKELIKKASTCDDLWIENDNERKKAFSDIIKSGNPQLIYSLIFLLYKKKSQKESEGKKMHLADEKILYEAQKTTSQEIAFSMGIEIDAVEDFVKGLL